MLNYRILPETFLVKMKSLLGDEYNEYIESLEKPAFHGLRTNGLKIEPGDLEKLTGWQLRNIPWIQEGFYYNEELKPSRHPYYYAGLYYLQEPSAMTPAALLPVEKGDCVLDLCAAPGGKSTQLAARLKGTGMLVSNDLSNSRAKALLKNLELAGASDILVTSEAPEKLADYFEGFFDKILVDAPCSGEGMFRRDEGLVKSFLERGPEHYSPIQKSIMEQAVRMLKPGGMLLYSTCTFDEEEDEGTIRHILDLYPDIKLAELEKKEGFLPGTGLPGCVRLFPHRIDGEGHFMALLQKCGGKKQEQHMISGEKKGNCFRTNLSRSELAAVQEFLKMVKRPTDPDRFYIKNNSVYELPLPLIQADTARLLKLRYLRTGLLLGELKKGRFEPSQALAMSLKKEEFSDTVDLSCASLVEDDRVIRYLKGETVALHPQEDNGLKSWCLVCTDGFPLGFAKRGNGMLKNKYYPGWRWL